jgi:hypothetical protein
VAASIRRRQDWWVVTAPSPDELSAAACDEPDSVVVVGVEPVVVGVEPVVVGAGVAVGVAVAGTDACLVLVAVAVPIEPVQLITPNARANVASVVAATRRRIVAIRRRRACPGVSVGIMAFKLRPGAKRRLCGT